jgi:integrase
MPRESAANLWVEQGWVFTNRLGGPVHPRVDHDAWKFLLRKAGVRDARLHDARHTAATMLLLLGVPSRAVMDVMGWSRAAMTTRYQHVTSELTRSITNQVGDLFRADGIS